MNLRAIAVVIFTVMLAAPTSGDVASPVPRSFLFLGYDDIAEGEIVNITAHLFNRGEYVSGDNVYISIVWGSNESVLAMGGGDGIYTASFVINASMMNESSIKVRFTADVGGQNVVDWAYIYVPQPPVKRFRASVSFDPYRGVYRPGDAVNITVTTTFGGERVSAYLEAYANEEVIALEEGDTGFWTGRVVIPSGGEIRDIVIDVHTLMNDTWYNTTRTLHVVGTRIYFRQATEGENSTCIVYASGAPISLEGNITYDGGGVNFSVPGGKAVVTLPWNGSVTCSGRALYSGMVQPFEFSTGETHTYKGLKVDAHAVPSGFGVEASMDGTPYSGLLWMYVYNDSAVLYHGEVNTTGGMAVVPSEELVGNDLVADVLFNGTVESYYTWVKEEAASEENVIPVNISFEAFLPGTMTNVSVDMPYEEGLKCYVSLYCGFLPVPGRIFNDRNYFANDLSDGQGLAELTYNGSVYTGEMEIPDIFLPGEYVSVGVHISHYNGYSAGNPSGVVVFQLNDTAGNGDGSQVSPPPGNTTEQAPSDGVSIMGMAVISVLVLAVAAASLYLAYLNTRIEKERKKKDGSGKRRGRNGG